MRTFRLTASLLAASLAILTARPAAATLIAQDSFSYPNQTVNGQTGGTGWSGAWITGQAAAFQAGAAISGAPAIGQTGGALHVSGAGRVFRKLDLGPTSAAAQAGLVKTHSAMFFNTIDGIGAPGTTVWIGMLVGGVSGAVGEETQYHLYDGARTDATSLKLGDQNKDGEAVAMLRGGQVNQWGFERTCGHSTCSSGAAEGYWAKSPLIQFGGTHWSVTRFVFKTNTTEITMWRDPAPGAQPPADGAALALTPFGGGAAVQTTIVPAMYFDTIAPNADGNYGFVVDEIRIGTTFADLSQGGGVTDGGVPTGDAGQTTDAGTSSDGGPVAVDDAGNPIPRDAGNPSNGNGDTSADGGCACSASSSRASGGAAIWGAALALLAIVRRRRTFS